MLNSHVTTGLQDYRPPLGSGHGDTVAAVLSLPLRFSHPLICLPLVVSLLSSRVLADEETTESSSPESNQLRQKEFYAPAVVQTVHLDIADEELQRMQDALPERIYVPAAFRWRDIEVERVAVRYKGNSSSQPEQKHKRSFLVKFNEFEAGQRFLGLRRVSFDNGIQFGSLFSEPIITEILHDLGVKSHRANYAGLYLNGEFHGIYVNVERIDESFVEQFLPDRKGSLFKVDLGGSGSNLQFVGDDPDEYRKVFELKSKTAAGDLKELVAFIRTVRRPSTDGGESDLATTMDLDSFLKVDARHAVCRCLRSAHRLESAQLLSLSRPAAEQVALHSVGFGCRIQRDRF